MLPHLWPILQGTPGDFIVRFAYFKSKSRPDGDVDPARDHAGLTWMAVVSPLTGRHTRALLDLVEPVFEKHGLDLSIGFIMVNERSTLGLIEIFYDRSSETECRASELLYDELVAVTAAAGYQQYRTSVGDSGTILAGAPAFHHVADQLKAALDPGGVIAPAVTASASRSVTERGHGQRRAQAWTTPRRPRQQRSGHVIRPSPARNRPPGRSPRPRRSAGSVSAAQGAAVALEEGLHHLGGGGAGQDGVDPDPEAASSRRRSGSGRYRRFGGGIVGLADPRTLPMTEDTLTMLPRPWTSGWSEAARMQLKVPPKLTFMTPIQSSGCIWQRSPSLAMPALLTSTWRLHQIHPIQSSVHPKRFSQTSRPPGQIHQTLRPAKPFHLRNPLQRLRSPQQNSFANPLALPRNIQHEMIAVTEIHIRMPSLQKQRLVPRSHSTKSVRRCISPDVSLRLHDPAHQPPAR